MLKIKMESKSIKGGVKEQKTALAFDPQKLMDMMQSAYRILTVKCHP